MNKLAFALVALLLSAFDAMGGVNTWTPVDQSIPFYKFTHVSVVALNPVNAGEMYQGRRTASAFGNVFKTIDGGTTWTSVFTDPNMEVLSILLDPVTPSTVYMATDQLVNGGGGFFKSTDSGGTWTLKNLGLTSAIWKVAIDTTTPSTLYVSTFNGMYKSVDGGDSWATLVAAPVGGAVFVDPVSRRVFASGTLFGRGAQSDIYKSSDGGVSWSSAGFATQFSGVVVNSFAVDPTPPAAIYAGTGNGILKSVDAGASWTDSSNDLMDNYREITQIAVIPGSPSTIFAASACGVARSMDAGLTWANADLGLPDNGPPETTICKFGPLALVNREAAPNLLVAGISHPIVPGDSSVTSYATFTYLHDAAFVPPSCTLSVSPAAILEGQSATLTASCIPAATTYVWSSNTGFSSTMASGTVTPTQSTTYTVEGVDAGGAGNVAIATVHLPSPRLGGISTRGHVGDGDDVIIAGFIIQGSTPKKVVIRARGPSLVAEGVANALSDTTLQLFQGQTPVAFNDNWGSAANAADIMASGYQPGDGHESAILVTLSPGGYTAIVRDAGGVTGVGLVEVFELDHPENPLAALATRGAVLSGDNVLIAGFEVLGTAPQTVLVRGRGPSLAQAGITNTLANPVLQLFAGQAPLASNDDWINAPNAGTIQSIGLAPGTTRESAILITLNPGLYTAVLSGAGGTTGVGIVEVFAQ